MRKPKSTAAMEAAKMILANPDTFEYNKKDDTVCLRKAQPQKNLPRVNEIDLEALGKLALRLHHCGDEGVRDTAIEMNHSPAMQRLVRRLVEEIAEVPEEDQEGREIAGTLAFAELLEARERILPKPAVLARGMHTPTYESAQS